MAANGIFSRIALALVSGVMAVSLLALSWPRLRSSLVYQPTESVIGSYWRGAAIDIDRFPNLIEDAERAVEILDDARFHQGLSVLHYLHFLQLKAARAPERAVRNTLDKAHRATESALRRAPARSGLWLRLAEIRAITGASRRSVMEALLMSILMARVEPQLLIDRVRLGVRFLEPDDPDSADLVRDQFLLAWNMRRGALVQSLKTGAIDQDKVRRLLENNMPELLEQVEASVKRNS